MHIGQVPFPAGVKPTSQENLTIAVVLGKGGKDEDVEAEEEAAAGDEAKA